MGTRGLTKCVGDELYSGVSRREGCGLGGLYSCRTCRGGHKGCCGWRLVNLVDASLDAPGKGDVA